MEQLFITIVNRGLTASLLVLAVIVIRFIFQRAPKRFRCVLWALVAFRLLCPFSVESVFSLVPDMGVILRAEEEVDLPVIVEPDGVDVLENVPPVTDEVADNIVDNIAGENNAAITDSTGQDSLQHNSEASAGEEVPPENSWKENLQTVGTYIWLAGIVSLGLYGGFSYFKVKNQVKVSLHEKENIYYCDTIETPFAFGMFRAKIYLPSGLDAAAAEYVIRHEKEHLRCRDQWWKTLGFIVLAAYWFHPMLWVAYVLFCKDIEYACDERVIKGLDEADRKEYVTALLNCSIGKKVILFCPTAFGETSVKGRIRSVLNYKKATLPVLLCAVALVALMVVAFLTDPVSETQKDDLLVDLTKEWASPTPAPGLDDELPPRTMIDGDIVSLSGKFTPIIPLFQEKIEQAKYCGIIRRISTGFPTEELESNSFQDGCKAYHYQDEFMETYIIVNPEGTKCFFAKGWTKYRWGETQLIKVEEREVNIFPTPIPTEAPANMPVASAAGTLVVGDSYAAYVDAAGNLHILYDMAGATKGVDREKKYKGLGLDRTCLVTIDVTGTVWAAYPYTADEVEAQMNELVEDAMAAGGNVGASHRDPELMLSFETLTSIRQIFCMYPYSYTALLEDGSLVTEDGFAQESLYGMRQFAQDENGVLAGIKEDGTFVIHTADVLRQKKFEEWPEKLQSICAGNYFVGLKEDGTVIAEDIELNQLINSVEGWKDIVSLSAAGDTVVGLKSDGTVVAVCKVGSDQGQCAVEEWKDIVAVDTNGSVTVGIQKDGSVVVAE